MINNLLNNAIKHSPSEEVMIEVKHSILKDKNVYKIEFRDNGVDVLGIGGAQFLKLEQDIEGLLDVFGHGYFFQSLGADSRRVEILSAL